MQLLGHGLAAARAMVVGVLVAALAMATLLVAPPAGLGPRPAGAAVSALPPYTASIRALDDDLKKRMRFSWHKGCPVPRYKLRYLRVTFYGFDGAAHRGELVVHRAYARQVVRVFRDVYESRFPIRRMRLVDDYQGSDDASMNANNTSAFNCRRVTGGTAWSQHSYGRAIDINPVRNPYVNGSTVEPARGVDYATRSPLRKGMVNRAVRTAFADIGWEWGGRWSSLKDYMHFSSNNR